MDDARRATTEDEERWPGILCTFYHWMVEAGRKDATCKSYTRQVAILYEEDRKVPEGIATPEYYKLVLDSEKNKIAHGMRSASVKAFTDFWIVRGASGGPWLDPKGQKMFAVRPRICGTESASGALAKTLAAVTSGSAMAAAVTVATADETLPAAVSPAPACASGSAVVIAGSVATSSAVSEPATMASPAALAPVPGEALSSTAVLPASPETSQGDLAIMVKVAAAAGAMRREASNKSAGAPAASAEAAKHSSVSAKNTSGLDVDADGRKSRHPDGRGCSRCGKPGHYARTCKSEITSRKLELSSEAPKTRRSPPRRRMENSAEDTADVADGKLEKSSENTVGHGRSHYGKESKAPPCHNIADVLPEDAPQGHDAYSKVRYWPGSRRCVFHCDVDSKASFQVSEVMTAGSAHACHVIARACFMKFVDENWNKDRVNTFKEECIARLQGHTGEPRGSKVQPEDTHLQQLMDHGERGAELAQFAEGSEAEARDRSIARAERKEKRKARKLEEEEPRKASKVGSVAEPSDSISARSERKNKHKKMKKSRRQSLSAASSSSDSSSNGKKSGKKVGSRDAEHGTKAAIFKRMSSALAGASSYVHHAGSGNGVLTYRDAMRWWQALQQQQASAHADVVVPSRPSPIPYAPVAPIVPAPAPQAPMHQQLESTNPIRRAASAAASSTGAQPAAAMTKKDASILQMQQELQDFVDAQRMQQGREAAGEVHERRPKRERRALAKIELTSRTLIAAPSEVSSDSKPGTANEAACWPHVAAPSEISSDSEPAMANQAMLWTHIRGPSEISSDSEPAMANQAALSDPYAVAELAVASECDEELSDRELQGALQVLGPGDASLGGSVVAEEESD